jgi:polar amino acid transport system substrate-binding protein
MAKKFALVLAVLLTLGFSAGAMAEQKTYVNGIDFGFPPFGFVDKQGKPAGFDVDSVNWIADKMGFKVKHQPMDWDGIIPALNAGKIDFIASGMSATAERNLLVDFSIPYYQVTQVLVVPEKDGRSLSAVLDAGEKIGVQRGTVTRELLMTMKKKGLHDYEVVEYDSADLALQDMSIGRIAGAGMDSVQAYELMKGKKLKVAGTFDAFPENYGYAVREDDDELLKTLNEGLKMLMADPYFEELKAKWDIH